jgi:hypothetical protein
MGEETITRVTLFPAPRRIAKSNRRCPQPFEARGKLMLLQLYCCFLLLSKWCFTLVSLLGVLADMQNRYLFAYFLARNISLVWLTY